MFPASIPPSVLCHVPSFRRPPLWSPPPLVPSVRVVGSGRRHLPLNRLQSLREFSPNAFGSFSDIRGPSPRLGSGPIPTGRSAYDPFPTLHPSLSATHNIHFLRPQPRSLCSPAFLGVFASVVVTLFLPSLPLCLIPPLRPGGSRPRLIPWSDVPSRSSESPLKEFGSIHPTLSVISPAASFPPADPISRSPPAADRD